MFWWLFLLWWTLLASPTTSFLLYTRRHHALNLQTANNDDDLSAAQRKRESLETRDPLLSLNLNLDALARANAPERAQELYTRINALYKAGYYSVPTDVVSFNSVLKAWRYQPDKALEFWEAQATTVNLRSYNSFLLALANAGDALSALALLESMQNINAAVRPDRISWNTALLSLANAEASEQNLRLAEELVRSMRNQTVGDSTTNDSFDYLPSEVDLNYTPPTPDTTTYNTLLLVCRNQKRTDRAEYWLSKIPEPDAVSYATVLQCWLRRGGPQAISRARAIVKRMQHPVVWAVALQIVGKQSHPDQAYELFRQIPPEQLDVALFSVLIDLYAGYARRHPDETSAAEQALRIYRDLVKHPTLLPNAITFTNALKAASCLPDRSIPLARVILRSIRRPSLIHYNSAIACCARAERATRAVDAQWFLDELQRKRLEPNTVTYNTVLSAAAGAYGNANLRKRSLQIGWDVYNKIDQPTSLTYAYALKMVRRLDGTNTKCLRQVWDACCRSGCLNDTILRQARQLPAFADITATSVSELPSEWSENSLKERPPR